MKFLGLITNQEDFTNKDYVAQQIDIQGGKIDTLSVDGVQQPIVNKNVNINISGKADKTAVPEKSITSSNGEALLWNEASGGGAKFINSNGVESFVGVNDGSNGIVAQIYADKLEGGKWNGAKIDVSNTGVYYTVGDKSAVDRMVSENEIATVGDVEAIDNYRVEKLETAESGYLATYKLVDAKGAQKGVSINIPKDFLVKSAELKTCTQDNVPVEGYRVGDKYIDFVINAKDVTAAESHVYIKVTELVDIYKADEATLTLDTSTNTFSIKQSYTDVINDSINTVDTKVSQEKQNRETADAALQAGKLDIMPGNEQSSGNAYNLPYYFYTVPSANKVEVHTKTRSLDGKNVYGDYSLDVESATFSNAGLMSAADKVRLDSIDIPTKVSQLENDVPYLTEHQSLAAYRTSSAQDVIDSGKQPVISDLSDIRSKANSAVQPAAISDMATNTSVNAGLALKQDVISDLDTIRSGAAKGATAVQDVSNKLDVLVGDSHSGGNAYNLPYYFYTVPSADKVSVHTKTVTLDGSKVYGDYSLDVNSATQSEAGLMSATDKIKLDGLQKITKTSELINDSGFLTQHQSLADYSTTEQMNTAISSHHDSTKQDVISDLSTIRSGAALGATAIQEHQDISGKQDKLTAGTNITITDNVISASSTSYTAGNGININDNTVSTKLGYGLKHTDDGKITLSAADRSISVGEFGVHVPVITTSLDVTDNGIAVKLADNTIEAYNSGTGQKGIRVNQNVIQSKLAAGTNVQINGNIISATDTVYDDTTVRALIADKASSSDLTSHTSNTDVHVTTADKTKWNSIPDAPTTDGTYTLECTVSSGVATFNWVLKS